MKKLISSLIFSGLFLSATLAQEYTAPMKGVNEFKQKIQMASGSIESIKSDFRQEKHLKVLTEPSESSGEFFYKSGGFVRWEYKMPVQQSIILNGDEVYLINEGKPEKTNARTARAYRQMNSLIADVIHGDAFGNSAFDYTFYESNDGKLGGVVMHPKEATLSAHLQSIELYFDNTYRVEMLKLIEPGGDYTLYIFLNPEYNSELPKEIFEAKPLN